MLSLLTSTLAFRHHPNSPCNRCTAHMGQQRERTAWPRRSGVLEQLSRAATSRWRLGCELHASHRGRVRCSALVGADDRRRRVRVGVQRRGAARGGRLGGARHADGRGAATSEGSGAAGAESHRGRFILFYIVRVFLLRALESFGKVASVAAILFEWI